MKDIGSSKKRKYKKAWNVTIIKISVVRVAKSKEIEETGGEAVLVYSGFCRAF